MKAGMELSPIIAQGPCRPVLGYVAEADSEGYTRIYLDPTQSQWYDISDDDIVTFHQDQTDQNATRLMVRDGAQVISGSIVVVGEPLGPAVAFTGPIPPGLGVQSGADAFVSRPPCYTTVTRTC